MALAGCQSAETGGQHSISGCGCGEEEEEEEVAEVEEGTLYSSLCRRPLGFKNKPSVCPVACFFSFSLSFLPLASDRHVAGDDAPLK